MAALSDPEGKGSMVGGGGREHSPSVWKLATDHEQQRNTKILQRQYQITAGQKVLLHLDTQRSYVIWFWAVVAAGAIPIVSTPLSADPQARKRHLQHLQEILDPYLITTQAAKDGDLASWNSGSRVAIVDDMRDMEDIPNALRVSDQSLNGHGLVNPDGVAFMMLTSGSTGAAKAVEISHSQVLCALRGKAKVLRTGENDVFLNWIGFDHVGEF